MISIPPAMQSVTRRTHVSRSYGTRLNGVEWVQVGDEVYAVVTDIDSGNHRVVLSVKQSAIRQSELRRQITLGTITYNPAHASESYTAVLERYRDYANPFRFVHARW